MFTTEFDHIITVGEQVHPIDEQSEVKVEGLIKDYEDVFIGMGCPPGEYDIVIDKEMPPVQTRPRKVEYALTIFIRKS